MSHLETSNIGVSGGDIKAESTTLFDSITPKSLSSLSHISQSTPLSLDLMSIQDSAFKSHIDTQDSCISHSSQPRYSNFHLRDIFGNYHRFFRPYTHTTQECIVRILPHAYCYTNDEIIFTKSKKSLISHTSWRIHPFSPPSPKSWRIKNIYKILQLCKRWLKFYIKALFAKRYTKVALLTRQVQDCYGHFIYEFMAGYYQLKLAQKQDSSIEVDYYILPLNLPFQRQMYEILGIPESKIIPSYPNQLICADMLIVPTLLADYEILEYRKYTHFGGFIAPLIFNDMYQYLLPSYLQPKPNPTRKIFLIRPRDSNRNIENISEVEAIFQSFGYEIILPDMLSLKQQILLFASSNTIASMHGSGLDNVIFANKGIKVFEIFSQYYHDKSPQTKALARGCKYFYMVGYTSDISMHPQQESVYIPIDKLKIALRIIEVS